MNDGEDKNETHNLKYLYGFHPDTTHVHTTLPHLRALVDQQVPEIRISRHAILRDLPFTQVSMNSQPTNSKGCSLDKKPGCGTAKHLFLYGVLALPVIGGLQCTC